MKRATQAVGAPLQQASGALYLSHESPYLTLAEGARFLKFDITAPQNPVESFRKWLHRQDVPILRRGRVLLVERRVLEATLRG